MRRGEQITYFTGASEQAKIASTGAEFRALPYDLSSFSKSPKSPEIDFLLFGCVLRCLPDLIETGKREKPDYVIYDFVSPWGKVLAEQLRVPAIALFPNPVPMRQKLPPSILFQMIDHLVPLGRKVKRMRQEISERFHRPPETLIDFLTDPNRDLGIVMTSERFQPLRELLGDCIRFVGPCYPDLPNPPEFPFAELDGRKVIYATLGTVYGHNRIFFRRCIEAFRSLVDHRVVLSTGNGINPAELGDVPPHILIRPFVPQWEILARADLFITHGGMNSIHAGLYHGVPMIVMPQGIATDQQGNARTIESLGAGVCFKRLFYGATTLRELSLRVMADPEIKARLAGLKTEFQQSQGPLRGAEEIIKFVRQRRTDSKPDTA